MNPWRGPGTPKRRSNGARFRAMVPFIRNTELSPASRLVSGTRTPDMLERPIDVKTGPDGAIYVLDFGRLTDKDGRERTEDGTGQIFRLAPSDELITRPQR